MIQKKKEKPNRKPKATKGRIKMLKAMPYKGSMIYIRMIGEDMFMYDLVFKKEIYSSYLIVDLKRKRDKKGRITKGWQKMTKNEINNAGALIFTGAVSTIDWLLGKKIDKKTKDKVDLFESTRKNVVN